MDKSDLRNLMASIIVGLNTDVRIDLRKPNEDSHRERFDGEVERFVQGAYALVDNMISYEAES